MVGQDFKNWTRRIQWVDPDAHASATDIATLDAPIDTFQWGRILILVAIGDSAGVWPIQVEASATSGGAYTAVTGALFSVGLGSDNTCLIGEINTVGGAAGMNRWLQLSGSEDGTGAIDLGVTVLLLNPVRSDTQIDFGSGGADELAFEV